MRRVARGLWLAAALAAPLPAPAADHPWVEVTTPHFVVDTNAGEGEGRRIGWQFEQVRTVFETLWPWAHTQPGRKFVVLAVRGEAGLKELAPGFWERKGGVRPEAVFVSGATRDWVALRTDVAEPSDSGVNPYFTAYQGYAHIALDATFPHGLPHWYRRGLASFLGSTVVRKDEIHVGRIVPWHMEELGRSVWLPLSRLTTLKADDPYVGDETTSRTFDAESWAFVHYLLFADDGQRRASFNSFGQRLKAGEDPQRALAATLGNLDGLWEGFRTHVKQRVFQFQRLKVDLTVQAGVFAVRPMSAAEALAAQAGFLAACRRPVEARALLAQARQADAALASPWEVEALLLDGEGKAAEARDAYARAAELGSDDFRIYHRLAQLLWTRDAGPETLGRIVRALEKASQLNPEYAGTWSFLASTRRQLDPGADVAPLARKAVALEPDEPYHHLVLAQALHAADPREAQAEAERALALSTRDAQRQEAQETLDWLRREAEAREAQARRGAEVEKRAADPKGGAAEAYPCEDPASKGCAAYIKAAEEACLASQQPQACFAAAWGYVWGRGLTKDLVKAAARYTVACDGGEAQGCTGLAVIHLNRHTPKDDAAARPLLAKACQAGEAQACSIQKSLR